MTKARWIATLTVGTVVLGMGLVYISQRSSVAGPNAKPSMPNAQTSQPATEVREVAHGGAIVTKILPDSANPTLRNFLDPRAPGRVPTDIAERIPSVTDPQEIAAVVAMLNDRNDHDTERNEAIELLRRSRYAELTPLLIKLLDDLSERPRFRAFLAQQLGAQLDESSESERNSIRDRLAAGLTDSQAGVRRESLLALVSIKDERGIQVIRTGLSSDAWQKDRDLIIRCHGILGLRQEVPKIRALAYDSDSSTRIAAIYLLGQWRDEASRPVFEEAIASAIPRIRNAGTVAMHALNGQPLQPIDEAQVQPSATTEAPN